MTNSIIFQNSQTKAGFTGRLGKRILKENEVETIVGDEDKQDNALKASMSLFSAPDPCNPIPCDLNLHTFHIYHPV